LTAEDLKDLGIEFVGHRRKLLDAIARLRAEASSPCAAAPTPTPAPGSAPSGSSAERRQLTVMFCDLVGSTALASRLDPEDLREVIGAYHKCVAETIARFEGFVAKYMGDGALVYFGYPQAHEDDAERAVRAGLALVDAVGQLQASERLQCRVGIATGLVVVGDLVGSGEAQERGVVGETPNLTARLQATAEPDAVVIAASTRRLLGDLFEYRNLGAAEAKGFAEPMPAWQVLCEGAVERRFEALHSAGLTALFPDRMLAPVKRASRSDVRSHATAVAGCLYGLNAQHDPRRASQLTWPTGCDDNGLLGALEPIDLLFELGDLLLSLGQGHGVFAI
jgi:class 3 adenylate cyclase